MKQLIAGILSTLVIFTLASSGAFGQSGDAIVGGLRCEYRTDPLAVDVPRPRLSWSLSSPARGARQTAYQIIIASSPLKLATNQGDLWDSGRVSSDETIQIGYDGKPLVSGADCFWKVRSWDDENKPGAWSEAARWTMGLLKPEDWRASWIHSGLADEISPWFRKSVTLDVAPQRALAHVNAVGYFELYVNGRKVSTDVLSPAVSDLRAQSPYLTYDIAPYLKAGKNCIGLWCGRGWATRATPVGQRVRLQCRIASGAGKEAAWIVSDESWKTAASPYSATGGQKHNNFGGERYDARMENASWCQPGFDDSAWAHARLAPPGPPLAGSQSCPPNRIGKVIPAVTCTLLAEGRFELDFGTNVAGQLRLRIPEMPAGRSVRLSYADRKYPPEGKHLKGHGDMIFPGLTGNIRYQGLGQREVDEFISAGKPGEFRSKFNYHGFRYVIVDGLPAAPELADAEASLIDSDLETAGAFECSNDLLNRIHKVTLWTIRCLNLSGYMVDCPHRERLGYGDGQVSVESQAYNLWSPAFYQKWLGDWRTAQKADTGDIPHTAPDWGGGGGPGWGGSLAALTWRMYELYGDRRIIQENYEPMRRYVDFLESKCVDKVMRGYGGKWDFIGDWVAPGRGMDTNNWPAKTSAELFNNCYRIYLWEILEKSAAVLGRNDEVARCQAALAEIRPAVHKAFFDEAQGFYVIDEQSYQVMPLLFGVVPPEKREAVFAKLEDNILNRNEGHLDTGMLGTYFLIEYLRRIGRDDLIFTIISQPTYPGWGHMLASGATTLWEQWNGSYSHIHSCFASPGGWFYQSLAGIQPDPSAPGFKRIIIKPSIVGDVTWVKAHHDSIHGRIANHWRREAGRLTMDVMIPANRSATVYVPAKAANSITESGKSASHASGVKLLRFDKDVAVFEVGGGSYQFQSALP